MTGIWVTIVSILVTKLGMKNKITSLRPSCRRGQVETQRLHIAVTIRVANGDLIREQTYYATNEPIHASMSGLTNVSNVGSRFYTRKISSVTKRPIWMSEICRCFIVRSLHVSTALEDKASRERMV